jgi:hypothetical protein
MARTTQLDLVGPAEVARRKPLRWFATSRCHWCAHMRKEHSGREGTLGCLACSVCPRFADQPLPRGEARRRFGLDWLNDQDD